MIVKRKIKGVALTHEELDGNFDFLVGGDWVDLKPYLDNGWLEFSPSFPIQYRKVGNSVHLRGLVCSGLDNNIFTNLPSEICPDIGSYIHSAAISDSQVVSASDAIVITSDGTFKANTYSQTWTAISCSYLIN